MFAYFSQRVVAVFLFRRLQRVDKGYKRYSRIGCGTRATVVAWMERSVMWARK